MPISEYSTPVQNTLEQYVPMPLQQMYQAAAAIQQRGDLAQGQADQVQTGLSSLEAYAPGHKDFVSKFANDFKSQQAALLDKYHGNTSDVNYGQESRKLNMQFAADPRLQTIKQTNEAWKNKQKISDELDARGIKKLDTNPHFTGTDGQGNLTSDVGSVRATAFDSNINQAFKDKENAMIANGIHQTNVPNLLKVHGAFVNKDGSLNMNNQDVTEGLQYYKQQGLSDAAAARAVKNHVDAGMGYSHVTEDPSAVQWANLNWDKEKFAISEKDKLAMAAMRAEAKNKKNSFGGVGEIGGTDSPILTNYLNKDKIDKIEGTISNTNEAGGIKKITTSVPDTPENRAKYVDKNGKPLYDALERNASYTDPNLPLYDEKGNTSNKYLKVHTNDYDPIDSKLVDEARVFLGPKAKNSKNQFLSDKSVLSQYRQVLANSQAESLSYKAPKNDKYIAAETKQNFGTNLEKLGTDYIVIDKNGVHKSGSKEAGEIIGGVSHVSFAGNNSAPVGDYPSGSIMGTGQRIIKNSSGNNVKESVTIIKPMDDLTRSEYFAPNLGHKAIQSHLTNDELIKSPEFRLPIKESQGGGYWVPQKGVTDRNSVGVHFVRVDRNGRKTSQVVSLDQIENEAHDSHYSRLAPSIDDKAEKQPYTTTPDDDE